jgi:hypothetical protein
MDIRLLHVLDTASRAISTSNDRTRPWISMIRVMRLFRGITIDPFMLRSMINLLHFFLSNLLLHVVREIFVCMSPVIVAA